MADALPQEFLQALSGSGGVSPQPIDGSQVPIPPAPEYGQQLSQGGTAVPSPAVSPTPGSWGMPPDPNAGQPQAPSFDQTLSQMLASPPPVVDVAPPVKVRKPTISLVMDIALAQEMRYRERNERIRRDIALYNQDVNWVPSDFDARHDTPVISPFIPNFVDKVANMLSAPDPRIINCFYDEATKRASQIKENFGYWTRKQDRKFYGRSGGGSLQWDEFYYLLLHGNLCCRILPDPDDADYPFAVTLIDPSQCYPIFKGDKHGLDTLIRRYQSTALDMINAYGMNDPGLERRLQKAAGYDQSADLRTFFNEEGDTIEYWDRQYRCVIWRDVTVMDVTAHNYGFVPFVWTIARGQPKSMATPLTGRSGFVDEYGNTGYGPSRGHDMAQKGVSIFHHLIHTDRVREVVNTIYLMEMEKALNPPTITYIAPQYAGQDPPPLNLRKKGNNKRVLNFMKVEAVPTSPRPTDASPLLNMVAQDLAEGSLPPVAHGSEGGSNVSGFAVESLIAVAKDVTLPYTQAFEIYLAQTLEMKLKLYAKFILPINGALQIPGRVSYGHYELSQLSTDVMNQTDNDIEVKLWAMSQQMLPGQIQAAAMAVQAGIWSLRKAMEHTGSLDPDRDFQDIITERAIQHPEIMENILIPRAFMAEGNKDLAEFWNMMVVMPKMQAAMGGMMPGAIPGSGGGGNPPTGPEPQGQSIPSNQPGAGVSTGGGPQAGEGRGPAG